LWVHIDHAQLKLLVVLRKSALHVLAGECSPQAQHVADAAVPVLLEAMEKDDDKEAVSVAIAAAGGVLRGVGGAPARQYAQQLCAAVGKVQPHALHMCHLARMQAQALPGGLTSQWRLSPRRSRRKFRSPAAEK
jgi:hypothetical protein